MHELSVLLTFAGGLSGALIFGYIAHRLNLSPIVGYLLAGVAVGPFTPGFVANSAVAEQFAEIGVVLLLFGIGLRFHLKELIVVWRVAVPGALIQSTLSTVGLAVLLRLLGMDWVSGLILGMSISVASTVVMSLVLDKHRDLNAPIGHIAIGWTVVEDILTVAVLLVLPIVFASETTEHQSLGGTLSIAALKIVMLVAIIVVLGRWVIPWVLERIEKTRSNELFTLAVLVLAVGIAVGSAKIFGVSMALGAFLSGLAVGRSDFAARAAIDAVPMRDAFAVLFFVSIGMLFDPRSVLQSPIVIGTVLAVVVIGKPLIAMFTVRILGKPLSIAIPVGAAFSQVGEFSFILGNVARGMGLIDDTGWNALVAASMLSIAINPTIYRQTRRMALKIGQRTPGMSAQQLEIDPNRCILIGYGPVGKTVYQLLTDRGMAITVIDLNLDTVRKLRAKGIMAIYGDVLRSGTLEEAGITATANLILSADVENAAEIVRQSRIKNPDLNVLVRCSHLRDVPALRRAGATVIAAGEAEVGVALAEAIFAKDGLDHYLDAEHREAIRRRLYSVHTVED